MEKITIYFSIQGNGVKFSLDTEDYLYIKSYFGHAQPAMGVFVEYDMRSDFAVYHPHLERYVFPALVGVAKEEDLKRFDRIEFIKTPQMELTYTIEQNQTERQGQPLAA